MLSYDVGCIYGGCALRSELCSYISCMRYVLRTLDITILVVLAMRYEACYITISVVLARHYYLVCYVLYTYICIYICIY
jgi:hypothetical protein